MSRVRLQADSGPGPAEAGHYGYHGHETTQDEVSASPVIVVDTTLGTFAFETFPIEAPKTVAHIVDLVKRGFYDGQRIHRVVPGFLVQWGDPRSRDTGRRADWGRGPAASSGSPIRAAEISKKRLHTKGSVAVASPTGYPALADSQIYVTLADRPELNGHYTVFGRVIAGGDVVDRLQIGDAIRKMFVKEERPASRP